MTVEEMLRRISSRELSEWQALYGIEAREHAEAKLRQKGLGGR